MDQQQPTKMRRRRRKVAIGIAAVISMATAGAAVVEAHGRDGSTRQRADVLNQGFEGVYQRKGAQLIRTDHSLEVKWNVRTPKPGSYEYPTGDMVPPGAPPHPEVVPGYPEVFTLWMFAFDHPELCSDGACNSDDIGDTPARGSVYQLDGEIARDRHLKMAGKVRIGQPAANGPGLSNPAGAEIHLAMAPHGQALDGADLVHQLNNAVGGPPLWFASDIILPR